MIDCSLYFSTICYVRLSKITAALLLPRRESERIPLLQERCFPIASAKVGHFRIPCKTSTKKNARKIHLCQFCHFIAWQNHRITHFYPHSSAQITPLPHSTQKIQADFSSILPHFSPLPPLFLSKPPHHTLPPLRSHAQDTRPRAHTRLRTHRISFFAFTPSPHTTTNCISIA